MDPAGLRETEFVGGMLVAAFPPVRRLRAYGINDARQKKKTTGSTLWFRDCHEIGGGACHRSPSGRSAAGVRFRASPYGARRFTGQPFYPSRKRQSSRIVRALEMARGRRKELAKWLRHILRPQYPRLLCIRLRSCMASIAAWPWKWPGGVERGWRCGCGIFSGPRIPACYVSGSVHGWPVAGWPRKRPGAVERGWRSGCAWFPGLKTRLLCARFHGSQALPAVLLR